MNVNSDVLAALLTSYQARFGADYNKSLESQAWRQMTQIVPSTTLNETVPFSGAPPAIRDTTDGSVSYEDVGAYHIDISNRVFQGGWAIQREAWDDDRVGLWANKPSELAEEAAKHPGTYIWELIELNGLAYDGVAFYSNSRTIGASANIDNILSGTGTDPVDLLFDLNLAQIAMYGYQSDKGRPMGRFGNLITCPIHLFQAWFEALAVPDVNTAGQATRVAPLPGEATFTAGLYTVVVNPEATDTNNWQLHHVAGTRKPFVMTERTTPSLDGTRSVDSPEWREERMAKYSTYARYGRGYGDPRLSVSITN